jgi:hypothetical protein
MQHNIMRNRVATPACIIAIQFEVLDDQGIEILHLQAGTIFVLDKTELPYCLYRMISQATQQLSIFLEALVCHTLDINLGNS